MLSANIPELNEWIEAELSYLRKNIGPNSIILDIGFGRGDTIYKLKDMAKKIVGVEISEEGYNEAKDKLSEFENIELFLEDAQEMHFPDEIFDYIICLGNIFGNLGGSQGTVVREMKRVLKKRGKVFISVYSEDALDKRLEIYRKSNNLDIANILEDGTVVSKRGIISEQYSKEKLNFIFKEVGMDIEISRLTPITYMCEATKN